MTLTVSLVPPQTGWTVDDLYRLPELGVRYELFDGSILVNPPPAMPPLRAVTRLHHLLFPQVPAGLEVVENAGVTIHGRRTFFIPDLCVIRAASFSTDTDQLDQDDVLLAIEVLSPSSPGNDLVRKRHYYAAGGIPQYWIVDPKDRKLAVLTLDGDSYVDRAVVEPGQVWASDEPFPLTIDPSDFL